MINLRKDQITNWVVRNFPNAKLTSGGRQIKINNPLDPSDTGYNFWISLEKTPRNKDDSKLGYWVHDWRTKGYSSSLINFIKRYKNISYFQAVAELCGGPQTARDALLDVRNSLRKKDEPGEILEKEVELPSLSKPFTDKTFPSARQLALNYLNSRKVSEGKAIKLQLHYTPSSIVFPYVEYDTIVYWQSRDMIEKRFIFPDEEKTGLAKTDYLYNFDNIEPGDDLIIVESIFNCISIGDNCGATGGAIISGEQPRKLRVFNPKMIILAPDNDEAGKKSLRSNYFLLHKEFPLAYCLPPSGVKDWNDFEQARGEGSARKYIERNTYALTLSTIVS